MQEEPLLVIMELMPHGALKDYLRANHSVTTNALLLLVRLASLSGFGGFVATELFV